MAGDIWSPASPCIFSPRFRLARSIDLGLAVVMGCGGGSGDGIWWRQWRWKGGEGEVSHQLLDDGYIFLLGLLSFVISVSLVECFVSLLEVSWSSFVEEVSLSWLMQILILDGNDTQLGWLWLLYVGGLSGLLQIDCSLDLL